MLALYTELKPFETFCNEEICPNWRKMISNNIDVHINLPKEDLEKELENPDSPIFMFYLSIASGNDPIASNEYISEIKKDFTILEAHPFDTFIFDITDEKAEKLKENYGIQVYSENEFNEDFKECDIDEDFIKDEIFKCNRGILLGWDKVLENFVDQNSNSIIIIDRNLFSNENRFGNLGVFNVAKYLNKVIKRKLDIPYQVLIITDLNRNISIEEKRNKIVENLIKGLSEIGEFNIEIEMLFVHPSVATYEFTHQRRILQNYHFGTSELGFSIFNNRGMVRKDNDFSLQNSFIRIKKTLKLLKRLKEIKENAEKKLATQGQNDRYFRLFNGENEVLKINNRLLNYPTTKK